MYNRYNMYVRTYVRTYSVRMSLVPSTLDLVNRLLLGIVSITNHMRTRAQDKLRQSPKTVFRSTFFRSYPAFKTWHEQAWRQVRAQVKEARTRTKRRQLIPSQATDWNRFAGLVNTPVQGLGADGMKLALIRLHKELPAGAKIILTVHDDVLVECLEELTPGVAALVEQVMTEEMAQLVPEVPIEVEAEILSEWK